MDSRTSKINYYLDIADSVSERATCLRRKYGAIIVRNDEIISTGYNGAPRGRLNCSDIGKCAREAMNIPSLHVQAHDHQRRYRTGHHPGR